MVGDESPIVSHISNAHSENETQQKIEEKQSSLNQGVSRFSSAVEWLCVHLDDCPRPVVPYVKQAYGLSNLEACEALRLANLKRGTGAE